MADRRDVQRAREEIQAASDAADGETQEHLNSIDEGLMELVEGDKVDAEAPADPDHFEELEEKLSALVEEKATEPDVRDHIERARDSLRPDRPGGDEPAP